MASFIDDTNNDSLIDIKLHYELSFQELCQEPQYQAVN